MTPLSKQSPFIGLKKRKYPLSSERSSSSVGENVMLMPEVRGE